MSAADHGSFSGLLDDDHTQYALLAGRSGGQTLVGGSGVTDVLNLQGTSGNGTLTSPAVQILVGNNGATTALTALNNGNVGIGTTSPTYRLSVKNSGTATNAFEVLRSGGNQPIFRVYEDANGYGVARVLDVNGLDKIYLNSNGNSYLNGGNVGIGTTSPDAALTVFGQNANSVVNVSGLDNSTDFVSGVPLSLTVRNQSTTENTGSGIQFSGYNASSLENIFAKIVAIHTVKTVGSESGDIAFITRSAGTLSEKVRLTSSGNVGIGTTSPATLLDVYGSGGSGQYQLALTGAGSSYTQLRYNGSRSWQTGVGNTGETTLGVAGKYYVYDVNASAVRFVVDSSGNVGIGTTSPAQKLDIAAGNIRVDDTTYAAQNGVLYKGSSRFLHNFNYGNNGTVTTEGQNLFLGVNAGNFTMGSTATQTYHASYNTGIGLNALYSNTIGYYNSAFGVEALFSNTTGYQNSAVGRGSLNSNTTGYYNSALGVNALYLNNTGYQNSALGRNAGRYLTDGSTGNTTGNNSLFLGYDTRAHADGETNQIVIGASAIGLGSNTVVLGNDSITTTALKGNVGIGTTSPSYKLVVNGGDFDVTSGVIRKSGTVIVKSSGTETMIGPGGNGSITFHNSGTMTSGDEKIRMDSSGNLGIGTTSPANLLDVYTNNVGGQGIRLSSALKNPLGELIYDSGAFGIYGYNTTNLFTKTNSSLVFGANNAEVMRIAATGNVGIGTTTPSYLLSLGGTAARTFGMERNTTAATAGQGLTLTSGGAYTGGTDLAGGDLALKSGIATGTGSSAIHFYTSTAAGASGTGDNTQTEKMTILGNGNVGIGTTSPLYSLDVSGAIRSNPSNGEGFIVTNDNIGRDLFVGKASLGVVMGYAGTAAMIQGSNNVLGTTPDLSLQPYGGSVSIGTTTPIRALTVAGGGEMSIIKSAGGMAYFNVSDSRGNNSGALTMRGLGSGGSAGLPLSSFTVDATESYLTGSVAVGFASSPVAKLDVHATGELVNFEHDGGSTSGNYVTFKVGGTQIGSIANSGGWSGIAYNTTSDRRLKEHIVDTGTGLDTLLQIPVRDFDFIADPSHVTQQGFIAQELYDVYPYAVTTNGDDGTGKLSASASPWGVDYGRLTPLLVRSIQELHGEQTSVRQTLEGRLSELGRVTEGNISDLSSRQSLSTAQLDVIGESLASLESEDVRQAERLAAIDARMLSVEDSVSGLAIASDRFDGRLSAIEGELSLLRDQNAVLFDFYQTFGIGNAVMKDAEGNVDLLEGTLSAATVKAGGLEIATHESDTPTAGSGTIVPVGEGDGNDSDGRTVRIETKAVRKGSLIYVTPVGSTHGAVLYVDDIESGEGFTVATDDPVRETVDFNWIVVGTGSR
ncbi:MAG: hypothetical protein HGB18_05100 [Candidatus Moranbacteria bacterium]|nr:hypothetical protein [Candidatus Moranbacteria bacterium]